MKLKFERAIDGDTLIASSRKIRIWGIDTPERAQIGYITARLFLESIISNSNLECKFIYKDKYQRDVMQCFSDNLDIGSVMVKFGMAKDYKKYSGGYYSQEEIEAKKRNRGLWSIKNKE